MDKRDQAYSRPGTAGISHGIPRHHGTIWTRAYSRPGTGISHGIPRYYGTIGQDGQEGLSIFQTWDCWDIPWNPKAPWDYMDKSIFQTWDWDIPWDPKVLWDYRMGWTRAYSRPGTGISHGIPRYYGTIGQDGQEGLSIFQTWDCWDIPWDPKAPWDNGTS